MNGTANTPEPPYYAVIFTSNRTAGDEGYDAMAHELEELVRQQPGFLGMESARDGMGITVSYWDSLEAIQQWKRHEVHRVAQENGRHRWYLRYKVRICRVERDYDFTMD